MNPVHSSLVPLLPAPGHFQGMKTLPMRLFYFSVRTAQVNARSKPSCPKDTVERVDSAKSSWPSSLLHQAIVNSHELRIVVVFEDELARANFSFLTQQNFCSQMLLQLVERGADVRVNVSFRRWSRNSSAARCEAFDLPNRQSAARRSLREPHAQFWIGDCQQSAAVACA